MNACKRNGLPAIQFLTDWDPDETLQLPVKFQKTMQQMSDSYAKADAIAYERSNGGSVHTKLKSKRFSKKK
jgi:hypothetical protein